MVLPDAHKWLTSDVILSKIIFSLVMSSPGRSGIVNGSILPQNALQHDNSCFVYIGTKLKIALSGVRSRVRESLAKRLI